mgnify:FL=1
MSTSAPALRRADSAIGKYKTNHPVYQGKGITKSCGKCGKHEAQAVVSSIHKRFGFVCIACTGAKK